MIEVKFYEVVPDERLKFAVILTRSTGSGRAGRSRADTGGDNP